MTKIPLSSDSSTSESSKADGLTQANVILVLLCIIGGFTLIWLEHRMRVLPIEGVVPHFEFIERSGKKFGSRDLEGKVWIADFIFTYCGGSCPMMSSNVEELQKRVGHDVKFVSFSVDPGNDTPAVLSEYAERYGAQKGQWFFLRGDIEEVERMGKENFKIHEEISSYESDDEGIMHSTRFSLVDQKGRIRGHYSGEDEDSMNQMVVDAKALNETGKK
jgi:protein SCO1